MKLINQNKNNIQIEKVTGTNFIVVLNKFLFALQQNNLIYNCSNKKE